MGEVAWQPGGMSRLDHRDRRTRELIAVAVFAIVAAVLLALAIHQQVTARNDPVPSPWAQMD